MPTATARFESDHRRGLQPQKPIVERHDLLPVRPGFAGRLDVQGGNGRLQRVSSRATRRYGLVEQTLRLDDPRLVP